MVDVGLPHFHGSTSVPGNVLVTKEETFFLSFSPHSHPAFRVANSTEEAGWGEGINSLHAFFSSYWSIPSSPLLIPTKNTDCVRYNTCELSRRVMLVHPFPVIHSSSLQ